MTLTFDGTLTLRPVSTPLRPPFWLVLNSNAHRRFVSPSGLTGDGKEYLDVSSAVAQQAGESLDPGETVVIPGFSVYIRTRETPPAAAFSVRATLSQAVDGEE